MSRICPFCGRILRDQRLIINDLAVAAGGENAAKLLNLTVPPGVYSRMLLVDSCEGLTSERGIAWRCTDSLRLLNFLGVALDGDVLDHTTLSRIRHPIDVETHASGLPQRCLRPAFPIH